MAQAKKIVTDLTPEMEASIQASIAKDVDRINDALRKGFAVTYHPVADGEIHMSSTFEYEGVVIALTETGGFKDITRAEAEAKAYSALLHVTLKRFAERDMPLPPVEDEVEA